MSRELYAYAQSEHPVLRSDFDETFGVFGWEYLLFEELESFRTVAGKFVPSCDLLAWAEELDLAAEIKSAVGRRDRVALDKLFADDLIGSVAIDLERPYTPDTEMLAELRRNGVEFAIIERIASSNLFYSVRTSAARNEFSLELQTMVANLLGIMLYGVIEDPQTGTFTNAAKDILEGQLQDDIPPTRPSSKPWWKFW